MSHGEGASAARSMTTLLYGFRPDYVLNCHRGVSGSLGTLGI